MKGFVGTFSGRSALRFLARRIQTTCRIVFVPRYICNVVPDAMRLEDWDVRYYDQNPDFSGVSKSLIMQLSGLKGVFVIVAPLFGGDGGLDWWISPEGVRFRRAHHTQLIFDFCQDVSAYIRNKTRLGDDWFAVFSFNDKSFPGVMGGGFTGANIDSKSYTLSRPTIREHLKLHNRLTSRIISRVRRRSRSKIKQRHFEYSYCTVFPYEYTLRRITKLQLSIGLWGLILVPYWNYRRRKNTAKGRVVPAFHSFTPTSPFVIVSTEDPGLHKTKTPYAKPGKPDESHYPSLVVRHNKGFNDRAL